MKHPLVLSILAVILFVSCGKTTQNPFFTEYDTPFQVPPFDRIEEKHYLPAFRQGIQQSTEEIQAIATNPDAPTFANTIEAMERSGKQLTKVSNVFYNLVSAHTNDQMQAIAKEVAPMLSKHRDDILLNPELYARVKAVYEQRSDLDLNSEQLQLVEEYYKMFVRGGADLEGEDREQLRKINEEISVLMVQFGENILKENNRFELVIDKKDDLAGLPDNAIQAAAEAATKRGHKGKWVFTLHKPSLIPFLQYSDRRDLREKMLNAYINRGNNGDELDNKELVKKMVTLRAKRAKLLGYETHAHYVLAENMAKEPSRVYDLLNQLWTPALERARTEAKHLQKMIADQGKDFKLQPWDWWYYAEKLKQERYAIDDKVLRPYFKLENVRQGAFDLATRLYGLTFEERTDIPKYHKEVRVYEVKESNGDHVGILYTDYYPRESKSGGAWMNDYRQQQKLDGEIHPIVTNVFNFPEPTAEQPALLSFDNVQTLFHEFGHALHGLLSDCTYPTLAGTNVPRDFVELPSQIMENWAAEPEVMKSYARHYQTGEPIPDELIERIQKARLFNQGFATVEYLAASFLDMDWHTISTADIQGVHEFERTSLDRIGLIEDDPISFDNAKTIREIERVIYL